MKHNHSVLGENAGLVRADAKGGARGLDELQKLEFLDIRFSERASDSAIVAMRPTSTLVTMVPMAKITDTTGFSNSKM